MKNKLLYLLLFLFAINIASAQEVVEPPNPFSEQLKRAEKEGDSRFFQEFMNMLFNLGIIIVLIMIVTWILKRMLASRIEKANITSGVKIIERRALTSKSTIFIVNVFGKTIALAESMNGVTFLAELKHLEKPSEEKKVLPE